MSSQKTIDPEVQAILEEVGRDPACKLLRVPKLVVSPVSQAPVRDRDSTLTRVERRLVKVHRNDVAQLLLDEAARRITEVEAREGRLLRYVNASTISAPVDADVWRKRVSSRLRKMTGVEDEVVPEALLKACVGIDQAGDVSPVQLATASLRLVPRATTSICLGIALDQEGRVEHGYSTLIETIDRLPSELMLSYAWQGIACIEFEKGNLEGERLALNRASMTAELRGDPAMAWFSACLKSGDRKDVLVAASRIEDCIPVGHPSVDEYIHMRTRRDEANRWKPTKAFHRNFLSIADRLPEQAWRIGHALSNL